MTLLTILGLLTQALAAWGFRFGAGADRGTLHQGPAILKRNDPVPLNGEGSASSPSAALLQPEPLPSFDPTSSIDPRLAVGVPITIVLFPAPNTEPAAAVAAVSTAPLRERGKPEELSVANYAALRELLEHCLSDEHLRHDKILRDKISSEANGWLDIASMVSCKNMTGIRLMPEDILAALKGSSVEVKQGGGFVRRPGNAALPKFESEPKGKEKSIEADGTASSKSLGLQPPFELGTRNATVHHKPADGALSLVVSPPVATPEAEVASLSASLDGLPTTRAERATLSAPDHAALLELVKYCLSDEYLGHDKTLFDRIPSEAIGWSEIALILTCRSVRRLRTTPEGALSALRVSELEFNKSGFVRRLGTAAFPTPKSRAESQEEAQSAERSTVSASSESLPPEWQPSLELGVANATLEHGAEGGPSPLLSSPVVTTKSDAASFPASSAALGTTQAKRADLSSPVDALLKQTDYCLSDEYLRYEKVFLEPISGEPAEWLDMALVLTCRNIRRVRATPQDTLAALKESTLGVGEGGSFIRRPLIAALPKLKSKKERQTETEQAENSASPTSSESLQPGLEPSFELGVAEIEVERGPADRVRSPPLVSPIVTAKPDAASVAAPSAGSRPPGMSPFMLASDHAALRKKIEYCLSDRHLRYDKFIHDKISSDPDGWLEIELILRCGSIKFMNVTTEDILTALTGSRLEVEEGGGFVRRRGNAALPQLELKRRKKPNHAQSSALSASSESLQVGSRPSFELEVPEATVETDRTFHDNLLPPLSNVGRDAELLSRSSSVAPDGAKVSALDHAALRRQVEYCLSDEHLRYDKFFHDKISSDPDGWLDIALILRCRNLKGAEVKSDDILAALVGSRLEVKGDGRFVRRSGNAALPKLEPAMKRKNAKRAERFSSLASSESLQLLQPSLELGIPNAKVEPRTAARVRSPLLFSPLAPARPEDVFAAPPLAALRPRAMRANMSAPDHAFLRKQVEYCLSDKYLRYDRFLHEKISSDPDGWLDIELLLTCQNIEGMKVTRDDIFAALTGSRLEVKEGGGFVRRCRNAALQKFQAKVKPQKKAKRAEPSTQTASSESTVESRPPNRARSPLLFSPIAAAKPEAVSVAVPLATLQPRAMRMNISASNHATLRKKVEYCLSDKYLRYDKFLHEKFSSEPDGWLDIELILRCPNMKGMKLSAADILAALVGSRWEIKEGGGFVRRSRNAALPKLELKRKKKPKSAQSSALSASSESLQVGFRPTFELKVPKATAETDRTPHDNSLPPLPTTERDAELPSRSSSVAPDWVKVSALDHAALRRQVEYCLSDEHLRYDKVLHDTISSDPDGWLAIALIFRCRNLKGMKLNTDDILAALMGSSLEVKKGGGFVRRGGNAALPKLELRREKKTKRAQGSTSSASSESLQVGFRPLFELEVPNPKAVFKSRLADRISNENLLSPLSTIEREGVSVASSSSVSEERVKVSAQDHAALRRQVEYCLSDEHLRQDKFLHDKVLSAPDGWLRTSWILRCKSIQAMSAKLEDLLVALEGSSLETKDGGGFVRWAGSAAVPTLEPKAKRQTKAKRALESKSSASSAPLLGGFDPSSEFPIPNAAVESAPSNRVFSPLLLASLESTEPVAASVAASRAALGERAKKTKVSAPKPELLRKHIENYLSDEYLRFNQFLRDEMKRVGGGWLEVQTLRNLTGLRATPDEISAALKGSFKLEVKEGGNFVRRTRNASSRPKMGKHLKKSSVRAHDGGFIKGVHAVPKEVGLSKGKQPSAKRIRQRREKGTSKPGEKPKSPSTLGPQLISNYKTLRARVKQMIHTPSDGEASLKDPNNILSKVHEVILEHVAIASFAVKDLRTSFALDEIVSRIVKSVYNSAKRQELRAMHFEEGCDQLVELAMTSYEASFGDQGWFFELDLAPAFTLAAWELWKAQRGLRFDEVEAKAREAFDQYLESAMLKQGMWEAVSNTFQDEEVQSKVFAAVHKAYRPAFDATILEVGPDQELERVQEFVKRWMDDSMARAWSSIPDVESVLTVSSVSELFQNMLAPFGPDHPFSTLPAVFTERIGLPPWNWDFVDREAERLISSWTFETSRVRTFKRTLADFLIW